MPGTFPPLANNPVVTGDPNKVIGIVLGGLHAPITVAGQSYNGMMPAWKGNLSNKDIADVDHATFAARSATITPRP